MRHLSYCDGGPCLTGLKAVKEFPSLRHKMDESINQRIYNTVGHSEEEDD